MEDNAINFGYPIIDASAYEWNEQPKYIRHYILTVDPQEPRELIFSAFPRSTDEDTAKDLQAMTRYARSKLSSVVDRPAAAESPFDMKVRFQGWLLVQLDREVNWQFTVGEFPCTLKDPDIKGRNILLRHLDADGNEYEGPVTVDGCRTLFFAVVKRDDPDDGDGSGARCGVNFNVEFLQTVGGVSSRLKLIIDPDVPNEGPESIP